MLVCPQCQSENPNNHQVCQQCGTSLTHKSCSHCHNKVPLNEATCNECGAFIGTVWQAILAQPLASNGEQTPFTPSGKYLDFGQRYQLWYGEGETPFTAIATTATHTLYQAQVIDCQPLQKPALQVLFSQASDLLSDTKSDDPTLIFTPLWEQMGIPTLAFPYFTLKDLSPTLPEVHDGWLENDIEVILLPDRRHWQPISDLLINESLLTLQIIYWLNQIVILWSRLSTVNCCQSLLIEENLRIDEDQSFGLGQLYPDASENPPSLQALGQLWQKWFEKGGYPSATKLAILIRGVASGEIENVTELRLELQDLASEQQIMPENDSPSQNESSFSEETPPEFADELLSGSLEETPTATDVGNDLATAVLPMELASFSQLGCTDRGRQRHHNEDYFGMNTNIHRQQSNQGTTLKGRGLYIVCDGMGGHAAGEVASKMAVETLQDFFKEHWQEEFPDNETIVQGILLANKKLYDVNQNNSSSGSGRMGTTLVLMLVENTKVAVAHVGDSRVYRLSRKGGIEQLTVDHEVGQRAIQNGIDPKIAYSRPDAYQLTQALGPHDNNYVLPDIQFLEVYEDTLFLLCSDGLCDNDLVEDYWETYLLPLLNSTQSLEKGLNKLIEFTNSYNGHDNITAVLVRLKVRPKITFNNW
ncbi:serine/threonine phosphatase [Crocosphaera sp. XPORK-15E]|uniref:serine/threonine phosphatase n=1 Tax=Crocosphaera sp. XPORK-15E TaxID=3110247 RepID=UPI002B2157E9|nr:serine/threonine phosphatase [Crocosphaera sp. XPORK-15E]MEA5533462.1 serine/threonine phosphatase [Crocosphaera sp. XPORK-15E]